MLDQLGNPDAITVAKLTQVADGDLVLWLKERKNRRIIPHRMEACDYVPVRNDAANDGLWKIDGRRQVVYAKSKLPLRNRIAAARLLS